MFVVVWFIISVAWLGFVFVCLRSCLICVCVVVWFVLICCVCDVRCSLCGGLFDLRVLSFGLLLFVVLLLMLVVVRLAICLMRVVA